MSRHVTTTLWTERLALMPLEAADALETYSVLTRLPGDARLLPADAALPLSDHFGPIVTLGGEYTRERGLSNRGGSVRGPRRTISVREPGCSMGRRGAHGWRRSKTYR